jgi:hypothetical protein
MVCYLLLKLLLINIKHICILDIFTDMLRVNNNEQMNEQISHIFKLSNSITFNEYDKI